MIFNDIAFVSVKSYDYRIRFWYMSKDYEINIMKNWVNIIIIKKKNKETILNRAKGFYENNKEKLRKKNKK